MLTNEWRLTQYIKGVSKNVFIKVTVNYHSTQKYSSSGFNVKVLKGIRRRPYSKL